MTEQSQSQEQPKAELSKADSNSGAESSKPEKQPTSSVEIFNLKTQVLKSRFFSTNHTNFSY